MGAEIGQPDRIGSVVRRLGREWELGLEVELGAGSLELVAQSWGLADLLSDSKGSSRSGPQTFFDLRFLIQWPKGWLTIFCLWVARDLCALCALSWRGTGPSVCVSYVIWGPSCPSRGPMPRFRFWFRFRNQGDTAIFPKCSQLGKSAANLRNKTHKSTPREILEGPKAKAKEKEEQAPGTRQQAAVSKSIIKAKMAPLVLALPIPGKHTQNGTRHSQCIVHGK